MCVCVSQVKLNTELLQSFKCNWVTDFQRKDVGVLMKYSLKNTSQKFFIMNGNFEL